MSKHNWGIGNIYTTTNCGDIEIIQYINCYDITIKFHKTGTILKSSSDNIRTGRVKDYMQPSKFGVGYLGEGKYLKSVKRKPTEAYRRWSAILNRCYGKNIRKCYQGVTVCTDWLNFQNFAKWFESNYIAGYDIDKDLKIPGNKEYSPQACSFQPTSINRKYYGTLK